MSNGEDWLKTRYNEVKAETSKWPQWAQDAIAQEQRRGAERELVSSARSSVNTGEQSKLDHVNRDSN